MSNQPERVWRVDHLQVKLFPDRATLGRAAGATVVSEVELLLQNQSEVRIVFAAAPSQNELLEALRAADLEWLRVTAFHLDEFVGLPPHAPQHFCAFLRTRLFDHVSLGAFHCLDGNAPNLRAECDRYVALLKEQPIDIVCLGIGENGHIAFNEPATTDFADPHLVHVVDLDERSRQQQVNDGSFTALSDVPRQALTLTIPAILSSRRLVCVVPGFAKRFALRDALTGPVASVCPASSLRTHPNATLFLDAASAGLVKSAALGRPD